MNNQPDRRESQPERWREERRTFLKVVSLVWIFVGVALVVYDGTYTLGATGIAPADDQTRRRLTIGVLLLLGGVLLYRSQRGHTDGHIG